jgi:hypothetical protein
VLTPAAVFLQLEGTAHEGITIDGGDLSKAAAARFQKWRHRKRGQAAKLITYFGDRLRNSQIGPKRQICGWGIRLGKSQVLR